MAVNLEKELAEAQERAYRRLSQLRNTEEQLYALEAKLDRIKSWCRAYPRTVFIEPTKAQWAAADKALNRSDCPSLTAISGSNMRHVVEGMQEIIGDTDQTVQGKTT